MVGTSLQRGAGSPVGPSLSQLLTDPLTVRPLRCRPEGLSDQLAVHRAWLENHCAGASVLNTARATGHALFGTRPSLTMERQVPGGGSAGWRCAGILLVSGQGREENTKHFKNYVQLQQRLPQATSQQPSPQKPRLCGTVASDGLVAPGTVEQRESLTTQGWLPSSSLPALEAVGRTLGSERRGRGKERNTVGLAGAEWHRPWYRWHLCACGLVPHATREKRLQHKAGGTEHERQGLPWTWELAATAGSGTCSGTRLTAAASLEMCKTEQNRTEQHPSEPLRQVTAVTK